MLNVGQNHGTGTTEAPNWYAVQTRSRHEKKVADEIHEKGISAFLPLVTRLHRWSDRRKEVQLPLFPGYVFVRTTTAPETRISVLRTPGVASFVGSQGRGTPIPDKQIEDIRAILDGNVPFELYPFLEVNERVRIRGGALDGVQGVLVAKNTDQSLVVSIDLIQRSILVRVTGYELERI
ncbi:MAG: UpxY family transcription antiterminator [Acidobacteriia bacterium]|nr:UpxY family transcription antiterminator [Terriglobia bacterium]